MWCATPVLWLLTEGFARLPSATVANSASKMLTAFTLHVLQWQESRVLHELRKGLLCHFIQILTNTICRYLGSNFQCYCVRLLYYHGRGYRAAEAYRTPEESQAG